MPLALDILNEIADRLGWEQIDSIEKATLPNESRKLLRLLNRVLATLTGLDDWPMLRAEGSIQLIGVVTSDLTAGTEQYVVATQNSTTVQLLNTTLDDSYLDRAIQFSGTDYLYRIAAVTGQDTIELNRAWLDADITALNQVTFTIGADRYVLPTDFDRPIDDMSAFLVPYGIEPISPEEFQERRRKYRNALETGEPEAFTIYGLNAAQTQEVIHFDPWPSESRLINYPYIKMHPVINTDNDKILYPKRVIEVIMEMVIQLAYRDYEDDDRMQTTLVEMIQKYNQSVGKKTVTQNRRRMTLANSRRRDTYRAYRAGGGNVDWGDAFDRAGNVGFF
jgi:hypothetical protein